MIKLLEIEYLKIRSYKTFWILFGLYFLFLALGLLMAEYMVNHIVDDINKHTPVPLPHVKIYFFPYIWQNLAFFATLRYVLIFPAIVVIILITNEFTNKTIRQNVITGMSKSEFLAGKLELILVFSLVMTIFVLIGTIILGVSNTSDITAGMIFEKSLFIIGYFVTVISFLVFALLFGFIFRNTGMAIALFTLYTLIAEPILYYFLKSPLVFDNNISPYLPANAILSITEYPSIPVLKTIFGINLQDTVTLGGIGVPLLYTAAIIGIVFLILNRKDL